MAEVQGSYDEYEKTWEDEDGARIRASLWEDGEAVIRTAAAGNIFSGYVTLSNEDREALIKHLGGTV